MLETVTGFVHQAGALVLEAFHRRVPAQPKGLLDVVTEADLASSELLTQLLRNAFPAHGVVSEEAHALGSTETYWCIDPLDGTKNFCRGIPHFCVTIALIEGGFPTLAITHDPVRGETFTAERGGGAHLNGASLAVSQVAPLDQAILASGFPSGKRHRDLDPQPFLEIARRAQGLRRTGSSALDLAYVAAGRFDAAWDWGLQPWDVAAGILLVREAGGVCSDWIGDPVSLPPGGIIAANQPLHPALIHILKPLTPKAPNGS